MLFGNDKLNTIEFLLSKALIDSHISHVKFISVNNVLREYFEMTKEIKIPETSVEYIIYIYMYIYIYIYILYNGNLWFQLLKICCKQIVTF